MWFLFLPVGCRRVDYFHILVDFPVFFLLLVSSSILYGWRRYFMWFQLLKCVKTCLVDYMWSVGRIFYVYLKRMHILLLWVRMFYKYEIQLVGGIFCLLFLLYITERSRSFEASNYNFRSFCFLFELCPFLLNVFWRSVVRYKCISDCHIFFGKLTLLCSLLLCFWQLSLFWSLFCLM